MVKKIRLVFGACCLPAARHDSTYKLQLVHVSQLSIKFDWIGDRERIQVCAQY